MGDLTDAYDEAEDVFVIEPPGAVTCDCGDLIGYVEIPVKEERCTVHPCHCTLTPDELQAVIIRNHPHLKDQFDE